MGNRGYKELQLRVTEVTGGYKGLQEVTVTVIQTLR